MILYVSSLPSWCCTAPVTPSKERFYSLWVRATSSQIHNEGLNGHQWNLMIFFLYPVAKQPAPFCLKPCRPKRNVTSLVWRVEEWRHGKLWEFNHTGFFFCMLTLSWLSTTSFSVAHLYRLKQIFWCYWRCDHLRRVFNCIVISWKCESSRVERCWLD